MDGQGLTEEQKRNIELTEEYRLEIRKQLDSRAKKTPVMEKFVFPALIVILTAGVSGWIVPWILNQQSARIHQYEVQRDLLDELVVETTRIEVGSRTRFLSEKNYLLSYTDLTLRFSKAHTRSKAGQTEAEDFRLEERSLESDRLRIEEVHQEAFDEYINAFDSFQVWHPRFAQKLVVSYPEQESQIRESLGAIAEQFKLIDISIDESTAEWADLRSERYSEASKQLSNHLSSYKKDRKREFLTAIAGVVAFSEAEEREILDRELDFSSIHTRIERIQDMIQESLPKTAN